MTSMNARNPSLPTDPTREDASTPIPLNVRPDRQRLPVGSQLNGLDEILAAARRRGSLAMRMS